MTNQPPMTCAGAAVTLGPANEPPARIELMPTGNFTLRDRAGNLGPIKARVSDPAALIKRSLATASGGMLPIDFAHGLDDLGARDGRAAGWITGLAVEGGKIMADVEWTAAGRAALEGKEYRFISPTFYQSGEGGEVTHIARAGLTNVPALPELKQVASQAGPTPYAAQFAELAGKLGMPSDTDPATVLTAIAAALEQLKNPAPEKETPAPTTAQAVPEIDQLSAVLASALDLPPDATSNEIVAALLSRNAEPAATTAAAVEGRGEMIPITAVATFMAEAAKQRHDEHVDHAVTAAMQAGRLPPALEAWGRDLCSDKPEEFDRFLKSSPFDMKTPVTPMGKPPVFASALAPTLDPADAITAQLGLPRGSLRE